MTQDIDARLEAVARAIKYYATHNGYAYLSDSIGFAEAAIAAYEASLWQPIETAPKDGTAILTWREKDLQAIAEYFPFANADWCATDGSHLLNVTHWQPLPAPPKGN